MLLWLHWTGYNNVQATWPIQPMPSIRHPCLGRSTFHPRQQYHRLFSTRQDNDLVVSMLNGRISMCRGATVTSYWLKMVSTTTHRFYVIADQIVTCQRLGWNLSGSANPLPMKSQQQSDKQFCARQAVHHRVDKSIKIIRDNTIKSFSCLGKTLCFLQEYDIIRTSNLSCALFENIVQQLTAVKSNFIKVDLAGLCLFRKKPSLSACKLNLSKIPKRMNVIRRSFLT